MRLKYPVIKNLCLTACILILLSSCATLKKPTENPERAVLNKENASILNGTYTIEGHDEYSGDLNDLKLIFFPQGISGNVSVDRIKLELIDNEQLKATVLSTSIVVKEKVFKGKVKNGFFLLSPKVELYPFLLFNFYRKTNARITTLNNGHLTVDAKQWVAGLIFFLPIPFVVKDSTNDNVFYKVE